MKLRKVHDKPGSADDGFEWRRRYKMEGVVEDAHLSSVVIR